MNLSDIKLNRNNLTIFPIDFVVMERNYSLSLAHNLITEIPESFSQSYVEVLDVSHNKLTTLPSNIGDYRNLQFLFASNNPIGPVFPILRRFLIGRVKEMSLIDLSNCLISTIPSDPITNIYLSQLFLQNNLLTNINNLPTIPILSVANNSIYVGGFQRKNTGYLDISNNSIVTPNILNDLNGFVDLTQNVGLQINTPIITKLPFNHFTANNGSSSYRCLSYNYYAQNSNNLIRQNYRVELDPAQIDYLGCECSNGYFGYPPNCTQCINKIFGCSQTKLTYQANYYPHYNNVNKTQIAILKLFIYLFFISISN